MLLSAPLIIGLWYSNVWNTGYLPINSNRVYDHFGKRYNVSRAIDHRGLFDVEKYEAYSPASMSAANLTIYLFFFAIYTATISYAYLYHRHEIMMGFRNLFKRKGSKGKGAEYTDVHNRLMSSYPEVSEWYYMSCLVAAIAFACAGIAGWETFVSFNIADRGIWQLIDHF